MLLPPSTLVRSQSWPRKFRFDVQFMREFVRQSFFARLNHFASTTKRRHQTGLLRQNRSAALAVVDGAIVDHDIGSEGLGELRQSSEKIVKLPMRVTATDE